MMFVSHKGADIWLSLCAMKPTYRRELTTERYNFIQYMVVVAFDFP
jgi:hypothetical protein